MNEKRLDSDAMSFTLSMDIMQRMHGKILVCDKPGWEHNMFGLKKEVA